MNDVELFPGDSVTYYVEVEDNDAFSGHKTARSPAYKLRLKTLSELYAKVRAHGGRFTQVPVPHHPRRLGRRSGGRLVPILRATKELIVLRSRLNRDHPE